MKKFLMLVLIVFLNPAVFAQLPPARRDTVRQHQDIEKEFQKRIAPLEQRSKGFQATRLNILQQLLAKSGDSICQTELRELESRSAKAISNEFDNLLAQVFVRRLFEANQLQECSKLLAVNCPEYVASMPLEYMLTRMNPTNGILVIAQAYGQAGRNAAGESCLNCLRRAFPLLIEAQQTDPEFVAKCAQWFKANQMKLEINYHYPYLPSLPPLDPRLGDRFSAENSRLFVPKP